MKQFKTSQEEFWAGTFGVDYVSRNKSQEYLASSLNFFSKALKCVGKLTSCVEFGANIGLNLKSLQLLYPNISLKGIEINQFAAEELSTVIGAENVFNGSIFDYKIDEKVDLSLIKGVLIHINPDELDVVYAKLYDSTTKYILIGEYFNTTPVTINYRGHNDRLFKRDFAGEMLDKYSDLKLVDYGFVYSRDVAFPQDDITWFLLSK